MTADPADMRASRLLEVAHELDDYAGAAADCEPIGTIAVPRRLLVKLRRVLREMKS